MSTFENTIKVPDSVGKFSLPYVVPANKYAQVLVAKNSSFNNDFNYSTYYDEAESVPATFSAFNYIIKVFDKP